MWKFLKPVLSAVNEVLILDYWPGLSLKPDDALVEKVIK